MEKQVNNKKIKIAICIFFAIIIIIGLFFYFERNKSEDPLNAIYTIENQQILLKDGFSEIEIAPGSASKQTTFVLWAPTEGNLNSDSFNDYAMIVIQNSGGSGTFYYAVAGLGSPEGVIGTNGIFLGDRISPENISIENGRILINYAERKTDDPMTAQPSVGVSKYLIVNNSQLIEE
ncbi:MAG: hypothetical protein WA091_00255 [Minisyncoccales bacterium]